jgi:hypothetical protein
VDNQKISASSITANTSDHGRAVAPLLLKRESSRLTGSPADMGSLLSVTRES